jgi:hypothetical protein
MPLNEDREDETCTPGTLVMISSACSIVDGRRSFCSRYV